MDETTTFVSRLTDSSKTSGKLVRISAARLGAEMTSATCGLGGLMLAEGLLKEPLEPTRNFIAKYVVQPHLDAFEWIGARLPSLQTPEYTQELQAMSPAERARAYAGAMMSFSVAFCASLAGQIGGQIVFDHLNGVPAMSHARHGKIALVDRSIQLGAILALNTFFSKPSVEAQDALANVLSKQLGMDKEHAKQQANYLINWQMPNILGAGGAVVQHFKMSKDLLWK